VKVDGRATRDALALMAAGFRQAVTITLAAAEEATAKSAKDTSLFRDRSGETRSSIHGEVRGLTAFVQARGASAFLENGTRAHWIGARVQVQTGVWRFIGQHPGTKPRPFMAAARAVGEQAAMRGVDVFVGAALSRAR
jgi:hypothetical protein